MNRFKIDKLKNDILKGKNAMIHLNAQNFDDILRKGQACNGFVVNTDTSLDHAFLCAKTIMHGENPENILIHISANKELPMYEMNAMHDFTECFNDPCVTWGISIDDANRSNYKLSILYAPATNLSFLDKIINKLYALVH